MVFYASAVESSEKQWSPEEVLRKRLEVVGFINYWAGEYFLRASGRRVLLRERERKINRRSLQFWQWLVVYPEQQEKIEILEEEIATLEALGKEGREAISDLTYQWRPEKAIRWLKLAAKQMEQESEAAARVGEPYHTSHYTAYDHVRVLRCIRRHELGRKGPIPRRW